MSLKQECKELSTGYSDLKDSDVTAFREAADWLERLEDLVKVRNLHLKPDDKYAEPLKLEKFADHKDPKSNIYEFLKLYDIISRGFTTEAKAHYLYANYLHDNVKTEVRILEKRTW